MSKVNQRFRLADDVRAAKYIIATENFKDVARATTTSFGTKGFLLRAAAPILIIIGVVLAYVALVISASVTKGIGSNSIVVDPPFTDPVQYTFTAPTSANIQYWSFRSNGGVRNVGDPNVDSNFQLFLLDPNLYKLGTIIVVRNAIVKNKSGGGDITESSFKQVFITLQANPSVTINFTLTPDGEKSRSFMTLKTSPTSPVIWATNVLPV